MTRQIRRSALGIFANIAGAFGREHALEKSNFYYLARESLIKTQSHLDYGQRVGYFDDERLRKLDLDLTALHHGLNKLIQSLKKLGARKNQPEKSRLRLS